MAENLSKEKTKEITAAALSQYQLALEMFVDLARNIVAVPILMTQAKLVSKNNTAEQKKTNPLRMPTHSTRTTLQGVLKNRYNHSSSGEAKKHHADRCFRSHDRKKPYFVDHIHTSFEGSKKLAGLAASHLVDSIQNYQKYLPHPCNQNKKSASESLDFKNHIDRVKINVETMP